MKSMHKEPNRKSFASGRHRLIAGGAILLVAGIATAMGAYESGTRPSSPDSPKASSAPAADRFVSVDVGGKRLRVNAQTLQSGPLTQDQAQQIADALRDNQSSAGLVEVKHADGTVEMDLQGRFQDYVIARKNDDGSVSTACVDNAEAARNFLEHKQPAADTAAPERKAAVKE